MERSATAVHVSMVDEHLCHAASNDAICDLVIVHFHSMYCRAAVLHSSNSFTTSTFAMRQQCFRNDPKLTTDAESQLHAVITACDGSRCLSGGVLRNSSRSCCILCRSVIGRLRETLQRSASIHILISSSSRSSVNRFRRGGRPGRRVIVEVALAVVVVSNSSSSRGSSKSSSSLASRDQTTHNHTRTKSPSLGLGVGNVNLGIGDEDLVCRFGDASSLIYGSGSWHDPNSSTCTFIIRSPRAES